MKKVFRSIRLALFTSLLFVGALALLAHGPTKTIALGELRDSRFGLIAITGKQAGQLHAFWGKIVIPWQEISPAPGQTSFERVDQQLNATYPVNMVGLLKANAPWAVTCHRFVGAAASCAPKDAREYARFVSEVVNRYKGKIKIWQVEDEVYSGANFGGNIDEYLAMLETANAVIHHIDPTAKVMVASTIFAPDTDYRDKLWAVLTQQQLYDLIDLHLKANADLIAAQLKDLKVSLQEKGVNKPIWVTELNGNKASGAELIKDYALLLGNGVEKVFWYGNMDARLNKSYSIMASLMSNYSSSAILASQGFGATVFNFAHNSPLVIAWADTNKEVNLDELVRGREQLISSSGQPIKLSGDQIILTSEPVFVIGRSVVATAVQLAASQPATLSLEISNAHISAAQTLEADVKLASQEPINLVDLVVEFPASLLRVRRVDHTSSDFSLVVNETVDNARGTIHLSKARLLEAATTDHRVAHLIFEPLGTGSGELRFGENAQAKTRIYSLGGEAIAPTSTSAQFKIE